MDILQAITLGVVQGLTEFLPVSSSGHLVLFQALLGMTEPALFFNVSVHVGTLAAVVIFFRRDLHAIAKALVRLTVGSLQARRWTWPADTRQAAACRLAVLICIGSVPTAMIGLLFKQFADQIFASVLLVGILLLITGTLVWATRRIQTPGNGGKQMGAFDALLVGTVQGLAVLPGISRSGATIATALFRGISRDNAARFSFLLSLPAIVGAEILSLKDLGGADIAAGWGAVAAGTAAAFIVGYLSLRWLVALIRKGRLFVFAPYCWLMGLAAIFAEFYF